MCIADCKGDFYRGCGCYKRLFYTGRVVDCNKPTCAKSVAHMHKTAKTCYCTQVYTDRRLVQNYLQTKCDECLEQAEYEAAEEAEEANRGRRLY
ncbi:hypothetical protein JB92DRAFT_1519752 [Gautieria morchelliformis]|nr:hypothetical protein JB92DRAFT_1519752 [Gautieria morchelliformis]